MQNEKLRKTVFTALFAALTCVSTIAIRIPTPGTGGYIHPGDAFVIISGIVLGPVWGFFAAGIGSALADVLGGYFIYVPITFAIKGAAALITGAFCRVINRKNPQKKILAVILGGITDIVLVAGGYFLYEIPMYSLSAAALSVPANLIQGTGGFVIAMILYPILMSISDIRRLSYDIYRRRPSEKK